jgi:iron complex transport system substrate-binding protein
MLTPSIWHYLAVENTPDYILMLPKYMMREVSNSILGSIYPKLLDKPLMKMDRLSSTTPFNVEESLQVNADLILSWQHLSSKFLLSNLKGLMIIRFDGGDPTKIYEIFAKVTQKPERVEWLWDRHEHEMNKTLVTFSGLRPVKTLVVLASENFSLWNNQSYSHFNANIKHIAGLNLAESFRSSNGPINLEVLLELDPDVIYITYMNLWQNTLRIHHITDDPRLQGLKAVIDNRVYHMPMGAMRLEGPVEEPLFLAWMAKTLHPGTGPGYHLRDEIKRAYQEVFNYQMSDEEISKWLRHKENIETLGNLIN